MFKSKKSLYYVFVLVLKHIYNICSWNLYIGFGDMLFLGTFFGNVVRNILAINVFD